MVHMIICTVTCKVDTRCEYKPSLSHYNRPLLTYLLNVKADLANLLFHYRSFQESHRDSVWDLTKSFIPYQGSFSHECPDDKLKK